MNKIKCGGRWLKDFGHGRTDDLELAHDFGEDEAYALSQLHTDYVIVARTGPSMLYSKTAPTFSAGEGRVWVRYRDCWYAAEKQALFLGTRAALNARPQMEVA